MLQVKFAAIHYLTDIFNANLLFYFDLLNTIIFYLNLFGSS